MTDLDFLKKKEVRGFIETHINNDVANIVLHSPAAFKPNINLVADQILARQKAKTKLEKWAGNFDLIFPPPLSIEQCSSSTTSTYKKDLLNGDLLVDLTGGMGIDCLAISDAFDKTIYVEQNQWLCQVFQHNARILGKEIECNQNSAEKYLNSFKGKATFYLDPARRDASQNKIFRLEDCSPNILELLDHLKKKSSKVLIKLSPLLDIATIFKQIPNVQELHVVSVKNDCKELLILIDFQFMGIPKIKTVNLSTNQQSFDFSIREEEKAEVDFHEPINYLYEPNSSILKAGAFKTIASRFGLYKIAPNTHFYTSSKIVADFPGRCFHIKNNADKRSLLSHFNMINVISRNHPLDATNLKKKYNLMDGGDHYLIAFRDFKNKPQLIIADRLDL